MKFLFFVFLLTSRFALASDSFVCSTELPSTTFQVEKKSDEVWVQVLHHNGTRYLPAWNGVITVEDLTTIQKSHQRLEKLGENFTLKWPVSKCEFKDAFLVKCIGGAEIENINGTPVLAWGFVSSAVTDLSLLGEFKYWVLEIHMQIAGESTILPMRYNFQECQKRTKSSAAK
jgi:hypothetical protein